MNTLKRWGARRVVLLVAGLALLLCCGGTLVWYAVDTGLRQAGALPTYTPSPTDAPQPTATVKPTRTTRPTATERPSATPRTNTPLPTITDVPTFTPEPTAVPATATPVPTGIIPTKAPQRAAPTVAIAPAASTDQGYTCDKCIKGNVNSKGDKLYHLPSCPSYKVTKIDTSAGERMFSSEAEARAAGWSKASNCP